MTTSDVEPRHVDESAVDVALAALAIFQEYVQQADSKINTILMVHTGGVIVVATGLTSGATVTWTPWALAFLSTFAVSFAVSGYYLVRALWPPLRPVAFPNAFDVTNTPPGLPRSRRAQYEQAWAVVRTLGEVALAKNRYLLRATPWTALMLMLSLVVVLVAA